MMFSKKTAKCRCAKGFWNKLSGHKQYVVYRDQLSVDHQHELIVSPCYVYVVKKVAFMGRYKRVIICRSITESLTCIAIVKSIVDSYRYSLDMRPLKRYPVITLIINAHLAAEEYIRHKYGEEHLAKKHGVKCGYVLSFLERFFYYISP